MLPTLFAQKSWANTELYNLLATQPPALDAAEDKKFKHPFFSEMPPAWRMNTH